MIGLGQIDAAALAQDSCATSKFANFRIMASAMYSNSLSDNILMTGPGGMFASVALLTGVYSTNLTGDSARFAWARVGSSTRYANVLSLGAGGSAPRVNVCSIKDATGSGRLVSGLSTSIEICWVK